MVPRAGAPVVAAGTLGRDGRLVPSSRSGFRRDLPRTRPTPGTRSLGQPRQEGGDVQGHGGVSLSSTSFSEHTISSVDDESSTSRKLLSSSSNSSSVNTSKFSSPSDSNSSSDKDSSSKSMSSSSEPASKTMFSNKVFKKEVVGKILSTGDIMYKSGGVVEGEIHGVEVGGGDAVLVAVGVDRISATVQSEDEEELVDESDEVNSEEDEQDELDSILTLYLVDILKFSETDATLIYHVYTMLGSFFPVIGGIIADSYLGRYKTILYLTVVYVAGAVVLTTASTPFFGHVDKRIFSIVGFVAIVIGSGCSSPCTLPFGGDQFVTPRHVRQLPMFFSLSYFAVNASALISMYVTPILRHNFQCFGEENCFPLAFGVLTFALIMSLVAFWSGKSQYIRQEPQGNIIVDVSKCIIHALKSKLRSKETRDHWLDHADEKFSKSLISDTKAAFQVLFLFLPMPVFWALYDQQGSSWKFQATRMNGSLGWFTIKPDQMQDINPLLIMVFIPCWFAIKPDQMQDINSLLIMVFIPSLLTKSSYFPRAPAGSSKPPSSRWKFQATRMNGSLGWFTIKPDQMQDINSLLIMGSSWKFQATRMNGSLGWFTIKPDQMQDINPLLIMVFIPLFDIVIYPWLAKYRLLERPLQRFTVGGLLAAVAFAMSAVLECNLETTYPVLPSHGLAQLRIFNGLECDVAFTLPMDPRSGVIPALDALQLTSIPLEGEAEYELRFMTAANCSEFRNRRFHGRVVLQEAKATSVFLHTIKGVPVVSTVNETDEIDKTDLENPRLRVLHSLRPFQSEFWLSQHKYHEMFEFEKDTFSTPYKSVVETGSFTAMLANRTVYGDIKLGPAGIYTLILHSHNNFTIGHVIEVTPPNSVHMLWQLPQYITITVAEIMFSVTGNEFAYTQAPDSMKSVISASWAMTDAVGNFIVVIIAHAQLFDSHATEFFLYSIIMVLAMVLFMLISCQYQYYDPIKETPPTISATIPPPSITPTS
ncbi:peptide transporter family 1-like [Macrosteles quadrilineatus]|uniref:peptide transporter family 1-like n=1 Tax=Macrosteles quadrilineatus TaxID=74068 RepID=UPI0023E1F519|nr:peptide transporter family 1-like [Macrosteles quadrilineatus]